MTDITGFGLIGHAREMALASNVSLRVYASRIPLLDGAFECVRAGYVPGALRRTGNLPNAWWAMKAESPKRLRLFSSILKQRVDCLSQSLPIRLPISHGL